MKLPFVSRRRTSTHIDAPIHASHRDSHAASHNRGGSLKRRIVIVAGVVIVATLVIAGIKFWQYNSAPVHIGATTFRQALSSRTTDAPIKQTYKSGEPIMASFTFSDTKVQTQLTAQVKKGSEVIRTYQIPPLRPDKASPDSGTRYISIVSSDTTALKKGEYTLQIFADATQKHALSNTQFTIK